MGVFGTGDFFWQFCGAMVQIGKAKKQCLTDRILVYEDDRFGDVSNICVGKKRYCVFDEFDFANVDLCPQY